MVIITQGVTERDYQQSLITVVRHGPPPEKKTIIQSAEVRKQTYLTETLIPSQQSMSPWQQIGVFRHKYTATERQAVSTQHLTRSHNASSL